MASPENTPRGYFKYILAVDCETTGLFRNVDDPSFDPVSKKTHQSVSWGIIVVDATTLTPIEKLYLEIKHNGVSEWSKEAEKVHGLSKQYLEENGVTEEEAVTQIASLIIKYWGPDNKLCLLGHNVVTFDMWFLKRLMRSQGINLRFGNRHIDTFSVAYGTSGAFNSDDLFSTMGLPVRAIHNSLEDIEYTLESFRRVKLLWNKQVGVTAYE
jgi:DNA polymerase III epsilon subunit-like protein